MTERGLPSMDGAPACPFVAFADDRDGRATSPDHRHRCFAESPPAPRAVAHQEAYCLSSAFPVCPTFQDWARREAAHARGDAGRAGAAAAAAATGAAVVAQDPVDHWAEEPPPPPPPATPPEAPAQRNPPRDWAAPPPWATPPAANRTTAPSSSASELLAGKSIEGQGLAGSAADQLAGGAPPAAAAAAWSASAGGASSAADDDLSSLVGERPPSSTSGPTVSSSRPAGAASPPPPSAPVRRPTVSSTRSSGPAVAGPSWERIRRDEAYPSIRTRAALPGIPRLGVLAGALAIAALALFMLPALLGIGGGGPGASPSATTPVATPTAEPTVPPPPTPQVYVIKSGDTLSKIANRFGVTLDELLAANKDTIKNPNKIAVGDEVIIPLPVEEEEPSDAAEPSAS